MKCFGYCFEPTVLCCTIVFLTFISFILRHLCPAHGGATFFVKVCEREWHVSVFNAIIQPFLLTNV